MFRCKNLISLVPVIYENEITLKILIMKKTFLFVPFILLLSLFFVSCEREISFENGGVPGVIIGGGSAGGSALYSFDDGGTASCTGATLSGIFKAGIATTAANTVTLDVTVDTVGTWVVSTSTFNGISFSGSGTFTTTGAQSITLNANGTPTTAGTFNFTPGPTNCAFSVTVAPGVVPVTTAVYSFNGGTGTCAGASITGTLTAGTAATAANTVVLQVNVDTIGTYSVTTTSVNGIVYSGSGTFTTTGANTITLTASGTPAAAGTFNFIAGLTGCTFSVVVTGTTPTNFIRCKIDGVEKTFYFNVTATEGPNNIDIEGNSLTDPNLGEYFYFDLINGAGTAVVTGTYIDNAATGGLSATPAYLDNTNPAESYTSGAATGFPLTFTVVLTTNTATRVEGTFSGTLYKPTTTAVIKTVTDGAFGIDK